MGHYCFICVQQLHNVRAAERERAVEQLETALVEDEARRVQAVEREQALQELVDEERAEQAVQGDQPVLVLQDDVQVRVTHPSTWLYPSIIA